jgi:hypothetical protein
MNKILLIGCVGLILTSCFYGFDPEINFKKITSDFWLTASVTNNSYSVIKSSDEKPNGGLVIIEENVIAVWHNEDFILAVSHPNYEEVIAKRLFGNYENGVGYLLENPSDTVYLSLEDPPFQKQGKWYHTSNGWNPPDSLNPYEEITNFHIIDIRDYSSTNNKYNVLNFQNEVDFNAKKTEFNIPGDISYTL